MIRLALAAVALVTLAGTPVPAQQVPAQPQKAAPAQPQKVSPPATQQKATAPATQQKAAAPATQQKATAPATQQKATAPATQQKATAPATQQKAATGTAGKAPAGGAAAPAGRAARADSSRIVLTREVYSYPRDGRRDPFGSLIATGDVRPLFTDLVVTGIMYDARGRNSLAMLQDVSTSELYRARVGSVFGRIRITAIREREVAVAIDEFGFTRQEVLSLNAPSPAGRTP